MPITLLWTWHCYRASTSRQSLFCRQQKCRQRTVRSLKGALQRTKMCFRRVYCSTSFWALRFSSSSLLSCHGHATVARGHCFPWAFAACFALSKAVKLRPGAALGSAQRLLFGVFEHCSVYWETQRLRRSGLLSTGELKQQHQRDSITATDHQFNKKLGSSRAYRPTKVPTSANIAAAATTREH